MTSNLAVTVLLLVAMPFLWAFAVLRLTLAFVLAYFSQLIDVWTKG